LQILWLFLAPLNARRTCEQPLYGECQYTFAIIAKPAISTDVDTYSLCESADNGTHAERIKAVQQVFHDLYPDEHRLTSRYANRYLRLANNSAVEVYTRLNESSTVSPLTRGSFHPEHPHSYCLGLLENQYKSDQEYEQELRQIKVKSIPAKTTEPEPVLGKSEDTLELTLEQKSRNFRDYASSRFDSDPQKREKQEASYRRIAEQRGLIVLSA
jgi:hypothetical protein